MKNIKMNFVLVGLVLWGFCGFGWAQTGQEVSRVLKFESSEQNEEWYNAAKGLGVIQPKYVAIITLRNDRDWEPRSGRGSHRDFLEQVHKVLGEFVSEKQQEFIQQERYSFRSSNDNAGLFVTFWLYAVSEADGRKMAEGYIGYWDQQALKNVDFSQNKIARLNQEIKDFEKRLPEAERALKSLNQTTMKLGIHFNHNPEMAKERVNDYSKMLGQVRIEVAGIQAKVEMTRKYLEDIKNNPREYEQLRQMLIPLEIDLAGALARKREIELQMEQANEFFQGFMSSGSLRTEIAKLKSDIQYNKSDLEWSRQELEERPVEMRPVTVFENKVVIHRVEGS